MPEGRTETNMNHLKIFYWNVHGLGDKINNDEFANKLRNNHIIILSETWLKTGVTPTLEGYQFFGRCRARSKNARRNSGGICIFLNRDIAKGVTFVKKQTSPNIVWLRLCKLFFNLPHNIYIGAVYIPPEGSPYFDNTFSILEKDISQLSTDGQILLMGDFNARVGHLKDYVPHDDTDHIPLPSDYSPDLPLPRNSMDVKTNHHGDELLNLCKGNSLRILNGRIVGDLLGHCTCYQPFGSSVVDYALADTQALKQINSLQISHPSHLSDHASLSVSLRCKTTDPHTPDAPLTPLPPKYIWSKDSHSKLMSYLGEESTMQSILKLSDSADPNDTNQSITNITEIYQDMTKHSCKIKSQSRKSTKRKTKDKPWMTTPLKDQISASKTLGANLSKYPHDRGLREHYHSLCKSIKRTTKKCKREFAQNIIDSINSLKSNQPKEFWDTLSKLQEPKINEDPPNLVDFCNYFASLTTEKHDLSTAHQDILDRSKELDEGLLHNPLTDSPITHTEIHKAIAKLKMKKSSGPDSIPNEIIRASAPIMIEALSSLFNKILASGVYPHSWNNSNLILIHKKDNPLDPANYRGISITSCISKLFNSIINERILAVLMPKLNRYQHGFTPGRRTSDPILIMKTLIDQQLSTKSGKLYTCFIDYAKAFDTVWRPGLIYKLQQLGIGKSCLRLIKNMYSSTSSQLKFKQGLGNSFPTEVGVKQGDNLSPTLFNIYINDLPDILDSTCTPPLLHNSTVPCLLFADDLVLLSTSKEGLENALSKLADYNDKWRLTLSHKKSNTMTISKGTNTKETQFTYNNVPLLSCKKYCYLGIEINNRGVFTEGISRLNDKALKAIFKIKSLTSQGQFPVSTSLKLFDSLVRPILTYNSDIWFMDLDHKRSSGIHRAKANNKPYNVLDSIESSPTERIHSRFIKYLLGVYRTSSSNAAKLEVGRLPLESFIRIQSIKNWHRILQLEDELVREALECSTNLHNRGTYSWASYIQNTFDSINSDLKVDDPLLASLPFSSLNICDPIEKYYTSLCLASLRNPCGKKDGQGNKLRTYATFKSSLEYEPYLDMVPNFSKRRNLTRLRISAHPLEIERGRYTKIKTKTPNGRIIKSKTPPEARFCPFCPKKVGDEPHFILECTPLENERLSLLQACSTQSPNFQALDSQSQFISIMTADNKPLANALANYCTNGFVLINNYKPPPHSSPSGSSPSSSRNDTPPTNT